MKGRLTGYQFVYDGVSKTWGNKAVANIVEREDSEVQGGTFNISERDIEAINKHEGYYKGRYDRKKQKIQGNDGTPYICYVYFRRF